MVSLSEPGPVVENEPSLPQMKAETTPDLPSVAFFTQGVRTPSARFRVHQFLPAFESQGLRYGLYPANPSNQGELRSYSPPKGLTREALRLLAVPARTIQTRRALAHDLAFVQKPMLFYPSSALERWISKRRPLIFDMDDGVHRKHGAFSARRLKNVVSVASHVIVGNPFLAEVANAPDKTTILPTVVDADQYRVGAPPEGPLTFGWTGLSNNLKELAPLADSLRRVLQETEGRLLLISERFDIPWLRAIPNESLRLVQWSPETERTALRDMHVGLMPLQKIEGNRGKCAFKLIQYMASGLPSVATPFGANRDVLREGEEGLFADTPAEWEEALMTLGRDPSLRERLGQRARARVEANFSHRAVVPTYLKLFGRFS